MVGAPGPAAVRAAVHEQLGRVAHASEVELGESRVDPTVGSDFETWAVGILVRIVGNLHLVAPGSALVSRDCDPHAIVVITEETPCEIDAARVFAARSAIDSQVALVAVLVVTRDGNRHGCSPVSPA